MIDFSLHSELSAKTQESAQKTNEQLVEFFAEQGVDLKEEFTKALQELQGSEASDKEVKIVLENAKNEIVENGGDSAKAEVQMNSVLKQLLILGESQDTAEQNTAKHNTVEHNTVEHNVFVPNNELKQMPTQAAQELLAKSESTKLPLSQTQVPTLVDGLSAEETVVKKISVHDLLLDKSLNETSSKATMPQQINQPKMNAKNLVMGGDDFLAQKVLVDKNQMITVDGEKVIAQKMGQQANANTSLKQYGNEQSLLDNRMFVMRAVDSDVQTQSKLATTELTKEEAELLAEVSNGPERMITKLAVNNTQNEAQVDISTATKVLDLSKIDITKTNELITKITEYIEQSQFEKTQKLDLVVKHDQLGQFKLQVNRTAGGNGLIDIKIQSSNAEAHKFFVDNEVDLLQTLNKSGIKVADLKITTGLDSQSLSQQGSNENKEQKGQSEHAQKSLLSQDQKSQEDRDSQKRRDLWQQYRERYSA